MAKTVARVIFLAALLVSGAAFAAGGKKAVSPAPVLVVVELQTSKPGEVEFFWDDFGEAPKHAPIAGGERTKIEFPVESKELRKVRIDPGSAADADIVIYGLAIGMSDGSQVAIPLDKVAGWTFTNLTRPELAGGVLRMRSTTDDPYFFGELEGLPKPAPAASGGKSGRPPSAGRPGRASGKEPR